MLPQPSSSTSASSASTLSTANSTSTSRIPSRNLSSDAQEHDLASRAVVQPPKHRVCCDFSRSGDCRAGSDCPFLHENASPQISRAGLGSTDTVVPSALNSGDAPREDSMVQDRRQAVTMSVPASRVVSKPVPQAQQLHPRQYQLGQVRRRFSPKESQQSANATLLRFNLTPSDPDFPFEITALECALSVPANYPDSRPTLKVANKDIPRGFAVNIEQGLDELTRDHPELTLLELLKALDKNLETFLSAPKAETVKLTLNKDTRHLSLPSRPLGTVPIAEDAAGPSPRALPKASAPAKREEIFTPAQKADASTKREAETRQLEARMGRLPLFQKSTDGIRYTIPITVKRTLDLPLSLRAIKMVYMFVPLLYPLHPCRIQLDGVDAGAAKPVERGFEKWVLEKKSLTLMSKINYLAEGISLFAKTKIEPEEEFVVEPQPQTSDQTAEKSVRILEPQGIQDSEKSHIQYISRPVEWTMVEHGSSSDLDSYSYDSEEESSEGGVEIKDADTGAPAPNQEKGTSISFPFIELYGIEIVEVVDLNISIKCERCKQVMEVKGLKNGIMKSTSCQKCATPFSITYRKELIHSNAVRAGFLDLEGCLVNDMLPSTFIPTCSECSTAYPFPGIVSIRGETTSNVCRECHHKFTFKIPEIRFLRISSADRIRPATMPRRPKETLGITPGTELPRRGRCQHYTKSYRWFRFSCCEKVYACDRCHDKSEEHAHEWANRMICGYCSREGNYRPEDCGSCHAVLVGRGSAGGFWEGGKGTRDPIKMSRKDKRKYSNRRIGGEAARSKAKAKAS